MSGKILIPTLCLSLALNMAVGGLYAYRKLSADDKIGSGGSANGRSERPGAAEGTTEKRPVSRPRCMLDALNVDASQQKRINAMRKTVWTERDRFHAEVDRLRRSIARVIARGNSDSEKADRERVGTLVQAFTRRQAAFRMQVVDHLLQVRKMLTDSQRGHFGRLLEKRIFSGMRRGRRLGRQKNPGQKARGGNRR